MQNAHWLYRFGSHGRRVRPQTSPNAYALRLGTSIPLGIAQFEKLGATAFSSGAELARRGDVLMICLPRSSDVGAAIFGPEGLAEGLSPGKILIDQTSGNPYETSEMAAQLSRRGVVMLDAPVSGDATGVEAGNIAISVSGPEKAYEQVCSVFDQFEHRLLR